MNSDVKGIDRIPGGVWTVLCLLLVLAAVPRVASWAVFGFIDSGGGSDTVAYLNLARNLYTGRGFSTFGEVHTIHHPFYPVLIGPVWKAIGDLIVAGQLVSLLAGIALVVPVYRFSELLFGRRCALYAGLFTAFFPILVYGSTEPFSESVYVFLLAAAAAAFAAGWRAVRAGDMAVAGALYGLAFLTHPAGITFLPMPILFLAVCQFTAARTSWRFLLLRSAFLVVFFALAASPWWIYLRRTTGHWQLSGSSHYQDIGLTVDEIGGKEEAQVIFEHMEAIFHPETAEEGREELGLFDLFLRRPRQAARVVYWNLVAGERNLRKTARFLGMNFYLLVALLAAGLLALFAAAAVMAVRKRLALEVLLVALMLLPALTFILVLMQHRYFYPFFPFGLVLLAAPLAAEPRPAPPRRAGWRRWAFRLLLAAFLAGSAGVVWLKWAKPATPYEYKILGEWMEENIPGIEDEKVMSFRLGVPFYAGSSWNVFYWGDYPGLLEYLDRRGVTYLVIDDYKLYMINPELRFLIEDPLPEEFEEVKTATFRGRRARLLRLRNREG